MAERKSKARFVLVDGMLGWGVGTGLLWAFFMSRTTGRPFPGYALTALLLFPLGGAALGWLTWRFSAKGPSRTSSALPLSAPARPALPVEAETRALRIVGWATGAVFVFFTALSFFADARGAAALFLPFVAISAYCVASAGTIRADAEQLEYACALGRFALRWSELTHVETDAQQQALVLCAGERRLPLVGSGFWSGPRKQELAAFLEAQLAERSVPIRTTPLALFRWPRQVSVRGADAAFPR